MTDLPQQLEDKKKELDSLVNNPKINWYNGWEKGNTKREERLLLQAEIAILEQAIAEIKKRDKDIDELAESSTFALCALMKENKELKDEMQKQRQEILDLFGEETKKEWEDGFYENEWDCDTLKVTPLEAKIVSELTSFLPRHMEVYDWNLPYAEEIILIIRRVIKEQLNQPKTENDN